MLHLNLLQVRSSEIAPTYVVRPHDNESYCAQSLSRLFVGLGCKGGLQSTAAGEEDNRRMRSRTVRPEHPVPSVFNLGHNRNYGQEHQSDANDRANYNVFGSHKLPPVRGCIVLAQRRSQGQPGFPLTSINMINFQFYINLHNRLGPGCRLN